MKLLKAPLLFVMTLICITSSTTFASRTFTPVLDTNNLNGFLEITTPMGNMSNEKQFFDTVGINIPFQAAILSNDYHNRVYGKSEFVMTLKESVFVLDSLYVNETKVKTDYNDFKQKLLSLRDTCGNFTLR